MLIGNYSVLSKDPGRSIGGGAIGLGNNRGDFNKTSMSRGAFTGSAWSKASGIPDGYRPPATWVLPMVAGGLSARKNLSGVGAASAAIAGGKNAEATLSGSGDMTAAGALIISMVASLVGSGAITGASAAAFLQLAAAIGGSGSVAAAMSAIAHAQAELSGSGDAESTIRATGALASSITVSGDVLTSTNVGTAVWSALAAANSGAGTMGEKLNDAGSASNPWTEVIEAGYTAAEILRILAAHAAGSATGLEGANPKFTGLDGTTVRIDGTYAAGTRGINAVDGSE